MENYTITGKNSEPHWQVVSDKTLFLIMLWNTPESCRTPLPSLENPRVDGSIPPLATNKIKGLQLRKPFLFFAGVTPGLRFTLTLPVYSAAV